MFSFFMPIVFSFLRPITTFGAGRPYVAAYPSGKSIVCFKDKLRRMTGSHMSWRSEGEMVGDVNRVVRGWLNYFNYGTLWKTYTKLERFLQRRLRAWLVRKHKARARGERRYPAPYIYETLGLVNPCRTLGTMRMLCRAELWSHCFPN